MDTPTQDIPKLEAIYTMDDIIKQIEASGVNLGDDPAKKIGTFIDNGLLPQPKNGRFGSFVVQRIIAIQNKLQEGKSISELKDEVSKERRRFLNQVTDLNSMVNLYRKFSNNSLFFLASLLLVAMVSIGILGAGLTGSSNPVIVAGESIVKSVINSGSQIAKTAAAPLGRTLVTIIKTSKPADSSTLDPLGLTNLEEKEFAIPENLVALNEGGNIELDGSITANNFFGDLLWSSVVERPIVLSAIDGVGNDAGNIDLVAGSGITILSDDDANTITFSSIDNSSSQFIFKNIAVSGQSNIVADLNNDTLTFVAGSNVSLTTNASTDTLTIGVTGTISNADTLDLLDSSQFLRSDIDDTMEGNINLANNLILNIGAVGTDFTATGGLNLADDLVVNANFSVLGTDAADDDCIYFDTGTNESLCWMNAPPGEFALSDALSITGNFYASGHLYTNGTIRVGNDGTLYNINNITASGTVNFSGATTITDDLTIGDGLTPGGWLTITATTVANVINTTPDSDRIILQGNYWDGGASQSVEMQIMTIVTDTSPSYRLSFIRGPGSEVAYIDNDGDFYAHGYISAASDLITGAGNVRTGASQLILQATGANADVVIQGGLCIRDATACNDVAAGGLEVDTAGGAGDDPGDVFDIAEIYGAAEPVNQGDVVSAAGGQKVKRSSGEYDQAILGIASSHPAALIDEGAFKIGVDPNKFNPNKPWVALVGRVPTNVSASNGAISPGAPLTSSSTPGVAMKAVKSGPIIGKALEAFQCPETSGQCAGKIMTFVSVGWFVAPLETGDGRLATSDLTDLDLETLTADTISTDVLFIGERKISFGKNGAMKIDGNVEVDGEVLARKISTDELVISSETSGNEEVKAGQKSVTIENDRVKENSKILVTFTSDYSPANRLWVSKKEGQSFTVHLDQPVTENSTFDWLIIN